MKNIIEYLRTIDPVKAGLITVSSRYNAANSVLIYYGSNKYLTFTTYVRKPYIPSKTDKHAVVPAGMEYRPDLISEQAYGSPDYWWKIMEANNMFDVIYAAGVFHHIPFNEHKEYLDELHRILKPNGLLILFELNPWNPGTSYIFHTHPMEKNAKMLTPHYAKRLTNSYGHKDTIFYCFFPHALKALRPLEKYLTNIPLGGLYGTIL